MISQRMKDLYFSAILPATYLNHYLWKTRLSATIPKRIKVNGNGKLWLNVGSGAKSHCDFVNIDGNIFRRPEMWLDLKNGIPFASETVDGIYASHVLEHFYYTEVAKIFRESYRVLKRGGGIRMIVPSLEGAITAYLNGNRSWFSEFPTKFDSLGGRFANFLFCDGQHRLAFDFSFAEELMRQAGFSLIVRMNYGESKLWPSDLLRNLEGLPGSGQTNLVVEAFRSE
jgi:prepilin-type processing-associated H-X9-DG protein